MLLVGRYERAAAMDPNSPTGGFGEYAGDQFGEHTLRWDLEGDRVILRSPSYAITADTALSVFKAVQNSNYAPIVAVFNVEAFARATTDRFFLVIESTDPRFDRAATWQFLENLHPLGVSEVAP